jgi:hypothetical protein
MKTEPGPELTKMQGELIMELLSDARDHVYRAAQEIGAKDPAHDILWSMAGRIEHEKIKLLRRCKQCS